MYSSAKQMQVTHKIVNKHGNLQQPLMYAPDSLHSMKKIVGPLATETLMQALH
jgi:hypothetical protein